jgi:hypothetical protein
MNRTPLILAIILLFLPILYVGSYSALVVPGGLPKKIAIGLNADGTTDYFTYQSSDTYRFGGKIAGRVFRPLEQIDQKLRPTAWHPKLNLSTFGSPRHFAPVTHRMIPLVGPLERGDSTVREE